MSNSRDDFSPVNRALVAGALVGATGSCIVQWKNYRSGEQSLNMTALNVARDAAKGAAIGGGVMAISRAGAGRPLLSTLAIISAGVASMYLLDEIKKKNERENHE
ncbi:TPA: hypothetical protein ACXE9F_004889 [Pluralibacter gergoviae]